MKISAGSSNKKKNEKEITIREIFEFIAQRWYWFLISMSICIGIAWCYLETQQPVYQRAATLLIDEDKKDYGENVFIVNAGNSNNKKQDKVHVLASTELMREVVDKLNLDVSYYESKGLRMQDRYKQSPVTVHFLDKYAQPIELQVTPTSPKCCTLNIGGQKLNVNYNDTISTSVGRLILESTPLSSPEWNKKVIHISRISPDLAAINYREYVTPITMEESSLYIIKYVCTSVQKADDILYALAEAYNHYSERDKQKEANNTAIFLDDRISQISAELETLSNELTDVQLSKNIASFESNGSQYAIEAAKIRDESVQIETNLSLARYIQNYVTNAATKNELIPNVGGVSEMGIDVQIQSYNNSLIQRNRLMENSGESNSIVIGLEKSLASTRSTIAKTINTYIDGLQIRLDQVRKQERVIQYSLTTTPAIYDSYRQKKIKESLYTLLLQKQEENALKMSNTDPVAKMIERPYNSAKPTPNHLKYLVAALLLGLTLPVMIWWIMISLDSKVRNRHDIEAATSLAILGEIPAYHVKKKNINLQRQATVPFENNDAICESFRLLSTQLIFALKTSKVVLLTSSTSAEGKSFIANNLSDMLNKMGKRVILIDFDIRKSMNSPAASEKLGVSDLLSGKATEIKKLIIHHENTELPDLLPAGTLSQSHNLIEQLMNNRLEWIIEELKKEYDILLLDSVPSMGLADSLIIGRVADLTIYVVREQVLDRRILPEVEKLSQEEKLHNMHIVLNDCRYSKRNYKGYYDYSKYYGYTYSYGSQYSKTNLSKGV